MPDEERDEHLAAVFALQNLAAAGQHRYRPAHQRTRRSSAQRYEHFGIYQRYFFVEPMQAG